MQSKNFCKAALLGSLLFSAVASHAGVDISGPVQRLQLASDGTLWFAMDTTSASTYCRPGWANLTMYVPANHPQYPYYFALLAAAATKGKSVYVANIDRFNGSASCDITQTGYGLMLMQ